MRLGLIVLCGLLGWLHSGGTLQASELGLAEPRTPAMEQLAQGLLEGLGVDHLEWKDEATAPFSKQGLWLARPETPLPQGGTPLLFEFSWHKSPRRGQPSFLEPLHLPLLLQSLRHYQRQHLLMVHTSNQPSLEDLIALEQQALSAGIQVEFWNLSLESDPNLSWELYATSGAILLLPDSFQLQQELNKLQRFVRKSQQQKIPLAGWDETLLGQPLLISFGPEWKAMGRQLAAFSQNHAQADWSQYSGSSRLLVHTGVYQELGLHQGLPPGAQWYQEDAGVAFWVWLLPLVGVGFIGWVLIVYYQRRKEGDIALATQQMKVELQERIEAEKALYASEQRIRSFLEFCPVGIAVINQEGDFDYVNSAFCSLFGYSEQELLFAPVEAIFPGLTPHFMPQLVESSIEELRLLNHQGKPLTLLSQASLIHVQEEEQWILFVIDITQRKAMEDQLVDAQQKAEMAAKSKEEFLAMVSHEIRTPMNSVLGMASVLKRTGLSAEQSELIEIIRRSGENLLFIINDILDLSKVAQGKLVIEEELLSVVPFVEECLDLFAIQAQEKRILLTYQMDRDVPNYIRSDSTRLRQVLVNLIGNALKFTPRGEIFLHISRIYDESQSLRLQFSVSDTGIGIPEEAMVYLFDAFSQADRSTTRRFGGSGLGLAICKNLVELMGGTIGVESKVKQGSTFRFTIVAQPAEGRIQDYHQSFVPGLQGKRALLLFPMERLNQVVQHLLKKWGLSPLSYTPHEILKQNQLEHPFDLVLLSRPGEGLTVTRLIEEVRQRLANPNVPVLLFSPMGLLLEGGIPEQVQILNLPFHQQQLFHRLMSALGLMQYRQEEGMEDLLLPKEVSEHYPLRILIADDNQLNLNLLKRLVHGHGFEVDQVMNGQEVLDAFQRTIYDLVFLDIQMPVMDGEACNQILKQKYPLVVTIALTAHAMKGQREKFLGQGFDDYLSKPIKSEDIYCALIRWILHLYPQAQMEPWANLGEILSQEKEEEPKPKDPTQVPLFDEELLQSRIALGMDFFQGCVEEFSASLRQHVPALLEAMKKKQPALVAALAHDLKGLSLNIGCIGLVEALKEVEHQVELNQLRQPEHWEHQLQTLVRRSLDHLQKCIQESAS